MFLNLHIFSICSQMKDAILLKDAIKDFACFAINESLLDSCQL